MAEKNTCWYLYIHRRPNGESPRAHPSYKIASVPINPVTNRISVESKPKLLKSKDQDHIVSKSTHCNNDNDNETTTTRVGSSLREVPSLKLRPLLQLGSARGMSAAGVRKGACSLHHLAAQITDKDFLDLHPNCVAYNTTYPKRCRSFLNLRTYLESHPACRACKATLGKPPFPSSLTVGFFLPFFQTKSPKAMTARQKKGLPGWRSLVAAKWSAKLGLRAQEKQQHTSTV